jgi:hypothetical protein
LDLLAAVWPASEAARLAELAASFSLFGLAVEQPGDPAFPLATADLAYRAYTVAPDAPANDWAEPKKPVLTRRGMHIDPSLPTKLIQATDWIVVAAAAQFAALWGAGEGLFELSIGQAAAFILSAGALKGGLWLTDYYRFSPSRIRPSAAWAWRSGAIVGLLISNFFAPDARRRASLPRCRSPRCCFAGIHAALAI